MTKNYLRSLGLIVAIGLFAASCSTDSVDPNVDMAAISTQTKGTKGGATVTAAATRDNNMGMGNPSNATTSTSNSTNYLMTKPMYTLSYNNTKKTPNWVSWHLSSAWYGTAPRSTTFTTDQLLPSGWYRVTTSDYTNSGFDRGHMCPSADRDKTTDENKQTFIMTNIVPQAPWNNQRAWANLETYCRNLADAGNEMYIISGPGGQGGDGSNGARTTIGNGVVVPNYTWKVILVLANGSSDASRVTSSSRVIAVKMPNSQSINNNPWGQYRVSVDQLESLLGYDFLSAVPASVQSVIESRVDNGPTQ